MKSVQKTIKSFRQLLNEFTNSYVVPSIYFYSTKQTRLVKWSSNISSGTVTWLWNLLLNIMFKHFTHENKVLKNIYIQYLLIQKYRSNFSIHCRMSKCYTETEYILSDDWWKIVMRELHKWSMILWYIVSYIFEMYLQLSIFCFYFSYIKNITS